MADETASSNGGCTLTREELLGTTNLNAREWRHIDPKMWNDEIEAPDNEVDTTAATTYMARAIADYTDRPTADEEIFGDFCQDFKGWTEVMFSRAHATYTKELKRILRYKGVYTGRANMPPIEAIVRLLNCEDCPKWPDDQFQSTNFDERSVAHRLQQERKQGHHTTGPTQVADVGAASRNWSQTSSRARDQDVDDQRAYVQDEARTRAQNSQQLGQTQRPAEPRTNTIERTLTTLGECEGITTRAVDAADPSADIANFSSTLETARKTKQEPIVQDPQFDKPLPSDKQQPSSTSHLYNPYSTFPLQAVESSKLLLAIELPIAAPLTLAKITQSIQPRKRDRPPRARIKPKVRSKHPIRTWSMNWLAVECSALNCLT
jgi:hypothetical protein